MPSTRVHERGLQALSDPRPSRVAIDPKWFRHVLGQYPTGVSVVTSADPEGGHAGMAVGSFTSVSLDPPLVAFLVDNASTTWPRIERAGCFCVNVLAADQEHICRAFAVKGGDKFDGLKWTRAGTGSPILEGAIAWLDCDIDAVHEAGDHYIVVGRVRELDIANAGLPLLFFQGGYGRFTPQSLATGDLELINHFRQVDLVRPELEALAEEIDIEANASIRIADEVVVIASAGQPRGKHIRARVGHRFAFVPPVGAVFIAWASNDEIDAWLRLGNGASADAIARERAKVEWIRRNGYSLMVGRVSFQHEKVPKLASGSPRDLRRVVHDLRLATGAAEGASLAAGDATYWATMSAPVFSQDGAVSVLINLNGFDAPLSPMELTRTSGLLLQAAARVTDLIGGRLPAPRAD